VNALRWAPTHLLLLLDNFEQVSAAAPLMATLLAECPGVRILVTSCERLHLRAEQRYPVQPLEIAAACELFIQRACKTVALTYSLTVCVICRPTTKRSVKAIIATNEDA
jgi:predicted ATPase